MRPFPVKRNTLVLSAVLFILAVFAWAGWANWEYRKQAAERLRPQRRRANWCPMQPAATPRVCFPAQGQTRAGLYARRPERQEGFAGQLQGQGGADQLLGHLVRPVQDRDAVAGGAARTSMPRRDLRFWASTPRRRLAEGRQGRAGPRTRPQFNKFVAASTHAVSGAD